MALPSLSLLPLGAPTGRRPIVTYPNSTHLRKPPASDTKEDCDCGGGGPPPAPVSYTHLTLPTILLV